MDLAILPQHWSAILCICIMLGGLVLAYTKKTMMVYALIFSNVIIFIITTIFTYEIIYGFSAGVPYAGLGFRSIYLTTEYYPQIYTIFTSMFIHGGIAHISVNMFVFIFIGVALEERIGSKKFIIIYLLSGIFGALIQSATDPSSNIPSVGASGAIFGIMGALVFAYPHDRIIMPLPLIGLYYMFVQRRSRGIKVIWAVLIWAGIETVITLFESSQNIQSGTAHFAHLGGLMSGFALAAIILRGRKTHTKEGKTVYYDSFNPQRPEKIDFSKIEKFATTPELRNMLTKIRNENVPQVRDIWLEHFFEKAVCPKCGTSLNHFNQRVWCKKCDFKDSY